MAILILTGVGTTTYVYKDHIPSANDMLAALQGPITQPDLDIKEESWPIIDNTTNSIVPLTIDKPVSFNSSILELADSRPIKSVDKEADRNNDSGNEISSRDPIREEPSSSEVEVNENPQPAKPTEPVNTSVTYGSGGGGGGGGSSGHRDSSEVPDEGGSKDPPGSDSNSTETEPDIIDPVVTITYPTSSELRTGTLNVTGTASDNGNVTNVEIRTNYTDFKSAVPLTDTWSEWNAAIEIRIGPTEIQVLVTDASGNTLAHSIVVIGVSEIPDGGQQGNGTGPDVVPPTIVAPAGILTEASSTFTKIMKLGIPSTSDNSALFVTVTNNATSQGFPLGTTIVQWTAKDCAGNKAVDFQNVTVRDTKPPILAKPNDITVESSGLMTQVALLTPTVTDSYDKSPSVTSDAPSSGFSVGTTIVSWTASDSSGNKAVVTQKVIVKADTTLPIASASPVGGLYSQPVKLQLSSSDSRDSIYYTLDGTEPTLVSAKYSGPIELKSSTTVRFFAKDLAGNAGSIHSQTYAIDTSPPKVIASPLGGIFGTERTVNLSANEQAIIYYTTDGTNPVTSSAKVYESPIKISSTMTLAYYAKDLAGNSGSVETQVYRIDAKAPSVVASPAGGTFASAVSVALSSGESGVSIFYTLDGNTPSSSSAVYSKPISITKTTTLKFLARDLVGNQSPVASNVFVIDSVPPTVNASPEGGSFSTAKTVSLTASESKVRIFYTTDNSIPTESSRIYSSSISVASTTTLKYFAKDAAGNSGPISSQKYVIDTILPTITVFPIGGLYSKATFVTLQSESGSAIFYTTDGTTPSLASAKYTKALAIQNALTLKYFAKDMAGNIGPSGSQKYTIDAIAPKITAPADIRREATGVFTNIESIGNPIVSDNIGPLTITNNATSKYSVGSHKILWSATDAAGNKATAIQNISVRDSTAPSLAAPQDIAVEVSTVGIPIIISLGVPSVQDLVDSSPVISNDSPQSGFTVGTTTVTWTAKDQSGNKATAQQKVTVALEPEQDKLLIRIMTINSDEATQAVIKNHLDGDDFVNNFRLPVIGQYPGQQQALNEQSIDAIKGSIATEIPASKVDVDYIEYDNEAGNGDLSTPESELVNPAAATNEAMKLIHEAGYKSGVAPTRRILMQELDGVQWSQVDYVVMQLQKVVGTQEFRDIADKVSTTTKKQNPDIIIFAQINPSLNTVEEIVTAISAIRNDIDGVGIVWTSKDAKLLDVLLTALGR